ncbi:MAG: nitroreductase family protein, partial [Clostridia bacterium]|nr:nitroreductase family protein [Clostridia bacterium]
MKEIFSRRSVRSYTGEMPTQEELDLILKAIYAAPVGMGRYDSLHVTVVKDADYLARLEAAAGAQLGRENYHPLYGAPVLLIFSSVFPGIPTDNSSYSNCAILSQNAALAAVSLG